MKRKLLVLPLALALLATGVSAHTNGGLLGDIPSTTEAVTVDGKKDAIYDYGLAVDIDQKLGTSEVKATAKAWLVYKDGNVYVYAEVKDADVVEPDAATQTSAPWTTDSLEVFINSSNSDNNADTMQYRIDNVGFGCAYNQSGTAEYGPGKADKYFTYACKPSDAGYNVEFCIPVEGKEVGINFQINDMSSDGSAQTWAMPYSKVTGAGPNSWVAAEYPYVTIGTTTASLPVVEEPASSATTLDMASFAAVAAALGAAGFVAFKKKK